MLKPARIAKAITAFVVGLLFLLNAEPNVIDDVSTNLEAVVNSLLLALGVFAVPNAPKSG